MLRTYIGRYLLDSLRIYIHMNIRVLNFTRKLLKQKSVIIVATIIRRRYEINFIYGNLIDRQVEASNSYGII